MNLIELIQLVSGEGPPIHFYDRLAGNGKRGMYDLGRAFPEGLKQGNTDIVD
ncbi:hypothetical protein [Limoniibacter endophyticus]|nr:hypothetical protein [Limoniibacter endophyticus]